jgi:muramoyltetrapeptide carboxypeptidase LdcA involved in peptidoglycan recycling
MYLDEANDVLISCAGGGLMCEILEYVDFEKINATQPKWYMGFSDNTNMTYLLATICDTASIYGPCASSFGMELWHDSIQDALDLLTGKKRVMHNYDLWEKESVKDEEHPLQPYNVTEPLEMKVYNQGELIMDPAAAGTKVQLEGRLLGGCMDCLVNLLGTEFDHTEDFLERYKEDGIVWFLEACDLNVFSIRRAMWQMEKAGWFKYVKGFLFGRPANGDFVWTLDRYQAVLKVASKYNVPVIMDMDIGHMSPMMPLVVGSMVKVDLNGNEVSIMMEYK